MDQAAGSRRRPANDCSSPPLEQCRRTPHSICFLNGHGRCLPAGRRFFRKFALAILLGFNAGHRNMPHYCSKSNSLAPQRINSSRHWENGHIRFISGIGQLRSHSSISTSPKQRLLSSSLASSIGAKFVDPFEFLCDEHRCATIDDDGVPYFRDRGHDRSGAVRSARFRFLDDALGVNNQHAPCLRHRTKIGGCSNRQRSAIPLPHPIRLATGAVHSARTIRGKTQAATWNKPTFKSLAS